MTILPKPGRETPSVGGVGVCPPGYTRAVPQFELTSAFRPAGDQPQAIDALERGIKDELREQILLGVTGSGKTYTVANVIERIQRPTLVMSPNKTLAAQLWAEVRAFFPNNAVEYFVSY